MLRPWRLLAVLAAAVGLTVAVLSPATPAGAAEQCHMEAYKNPQGGISYHKVCTNVDSSKNGQSGGENTCQTDKMAPSLGGGWFCIGRAVCHERPPWTGFGQPTTPPPPGESYVFIECWPCNGCLGPPAPSWILSGAGPRPLIVQAREAFARIDPPAVVVKHSPDSDAFARMDTWFWLAGGAALGRLTGSSAEGLVAVAEPAGTSWDPGDRTGTFACVGSGTEWAPGKDPTNACRHTYLEGSDEDGYQGAVTRRWAVHYENGGAPVAITGAPGTLQVTTTFDLLVLENQVVVGR
jgi:hypothetical protein